MKCSLENNDKKISQILGGETTVGEMKKILKEKYQNEYGEEDFNKKKIDIFFKGEKLNEDNIQIWEINEGEDIDLMMLSFSVDDSITEEEKSISKSPKYRAKVLNKLVTICPFHSDDKELSICITCGVSFCSKCAGKHKTHKTVKKMDIIEYSDEIQNIKSNSDKFFTQISNEFFSNKNLDISISSEISENNIINIKIRKNKKLEKLYTEICKTEINDVLSVFDLIQQTIDSSKQYINKEINEFKGNLANSAPFLLEFKEKLDILSRDSYRITTFKNEKEFIDYYYGYVNIKNKAEKFQEQITNIRESIDNFKELMNSILQKLQTISSEMNDNFESILSMKSTVTNLPNIQTGIFGLNDPSFQVKNSGIVNKSANKQDSIISLIKSPTINSTYSQHFGKMNLVTLMASKDNRNRFMANEEKNYMNNLKGNNQSEIAEENIEGASFSTKLQEENIEENLIYDINPRTKKLFTFNKGDNNINEIELSLTESPIKRFEIYHSTLNYKGKFYLSGGYSTSKLFSYFSSQKKEFVKLNDMANGHIYHTLIGIDQYILAVGGFKNKNVERYDLNTKTWASLEPLDISLSNPCCFSVENKYLYVLGGLKENDSEENGENKIRRIDITDINNKFEIIELVTEVNLPISFGSLSLSPDCILLLGGKSNSSSNNSEKCLSFFPKENRLEICADFSLPSRDEFLGKPFSDLGEGIFSLFSGSNSGKVFTVDLGNKEIKELLYENKKL